MAAFLEEFFPAGAPQAADPPSDERLCARIRKLVEFAARNGPAFVEEVRHKQQNNPEYSFLFPIDPAYRYYMYVLYQTVSQRNSASRDNTGLQHLDLAFPAGMIPKLVSSQINMYEPYAPLNAADIMAAGVPNPPTMDEYLNTRINKLYAQLEEFRPGVAFCDVETESGRTAEVSDGRDTMRATAAVSMDDGSFQGVAAGPNRGLGYGSQTQSKEDDLYAKFRQMQSSRRHVHKMDF